MNVKRILGFCFLLVLFSLVSCGKAQTSKNSITVEDTVEAPVDLYWTIGEGGDTVSDKNGFSIPLKTYNRIILISPGAVETFYLIGAEDRIAAISDSRDPVWPEEKTVLLPSIGNVARPNLEAIIALEPDLIIGNAMSTALVTDMAARGYPALIHSADSFADIFNGTRIMGRLTGREAAAETLATERERELESLRRELATQPLTYRGAPLKGAFLYSASPIMAFTGASLPGEILSLLGVDNIAAGLDAAQPILSPEYILAQDPDFLFGSMTITKPEDVLAADSVIARTRAGREMNISLVSSSLFLRASPRTVESLWEMYREVRGFGD
jgi:iron complex transport system substrate-binding protein